MIAALARELAVPEAHLRALVEVESAGVGLVDGRPVIRVEVHRLWALAAPEQRHLLDARFRVLGPRAWQGHTWRPEEGGTWTPLHQVGRVGQAAEWAAYDLACHLVGADAATRATSWGAAQVLGDWRGLGYDSPEALVQAVHTEQGQLDLLGRYLRARPALLEALRAGAWEEVARQYNGPGAVAVYAAKLRLALGRST